MAIECMPLAKIAFRDFQCVLSKAPLYKGDNWTGVPPLCAVLIVLFAVTGSTANWGVLASIKFSYSKGLNSTITPDKEPCDA